MLIERFVERQRIPFEVIQHYRPHLVDASKRRSHDKEYLRRTQIGVWGADNEWNYFLHGGGCHVTHTDTEEVIGWDAANLLQIDGHWFADWVYWYISHNSKDESTSPVFALITKSQDDVKRSIIDVLNQLHELGILQRHPTFFTKYKIVH